MEQSPTLSRTVARTGSSRSAAVGALGWALTRHGLALILLWIGAMKFTAYEAAGIQPMVANSPLMSWLYSLATVQAVSNALGVVEIATALLILARPLSPKLAALGSAAAVATFGVTLTFIFTTPGWESSLGGFPALSAMPGQFLLKDLVLAGASLMILGEALESATA